MGYLASSKIGRRLERFMGMARGQGFLASVMVLAGGTAVGQMVLVLASPILTRLYSPIDLGLLGLFTSFLSVASVSVTLRYEGAIVAAKDEEEAGYLIIGSTAATLLSSVLMSVLLYLMIEYDLFNFGTMPGWVALLAYPAVVLTAQFGILRYWFLREKHFTIVTQVTVVQNIARTVVQVGLGLVHLGWGGLLLGEMAGRASGNGRMLRACWPYLRKSLRLARLNDLLRVLKVYIKYPAYNLPSTLINTLVVSLPIPIIAQLYGEAPAGHFTLVQRVLSLPLVLVGRSVADAFHTHLAAGDQQELCYFLVCVLTAGSV